MAKGKPAKDVEWLSADAFTKDEAVFKDGKWWVRVRVSGEVVINGTEYILDATELFSVDECMINPDGSFKE